MCVSIVTEWEEPGIWSQKVYILYFVLVCILARLSQYYHRQQERPWWSHGWGSGLLRQGGSDSIPSQGTGSQVPQLRVCLPQLKILHVTLNIKDSICHS